MTKSGSYYYDDQGLKYGIMNYYIDGSLVELLAVTNCTNNIPASGEITIPNYISYQDPNNITPTTYPVRLFMIESDYKSRVKKIDASGCTNLEIMPRSFENYYKLEVADFSGCTNLQYVGSTMFRGCTALEVADFSGCTKLDIIDSGAFQGCTALEVADFSGCTNLQTIASYVFDGCTNLTIADFSGCINLQTVTTYAFQGCSKAEVIFESGAFSATDSSTAASMLSNTKRVTILGGDNSKVSNGGKKVTFEQLSVNGDGNLTSKPVMVQYIRDTSGTSNYVKDPSGPAYTYTNADGTTVTRKYQYTDNGTKKDYGSFWRLPNSAAAFSFGGDAGTSGSTGFTTDITLIDQRAVVFDANGGTFSTLGNPPYVTTSDYNFFNSDMTKYTTLACQNGSSYVIFRPLGNDVVSRADYDCLGYAESATGASVITNLNAYVSGKINSSPVTIYSAWAPKYKIVEFKLQKTFASGGRQFFAAIGTAASEQSPQQSITEFLKSNVVANMFDVKRAANSTTTEETSLANKTTALAAGSDDLGYYVITDVAYTDKSNFFTVTFNVVVPVGDTSGEIRLREKTDFAPGLFTATYNNNAANTYCAIPYTNLTELSD